MLILEKCYAHQTSPPSRVAALPNSQLLQGISSALRRSRVLPPLAFSWTTGLLVTDLCLVCA